MDIESGSLPLLDEALILIGVFIMLLAINCAIKILKHPGVKKYRTNWKVLIGLMIFFLLNGIVLSIIVSLGYEQLFDVIAAIVILLGSLFVYLTVRMGYLTINDLGTSVRELESSIAKRSMLERELMVNHDRLTRQNNVLKSLTKNLIGVDTLSSLKNITEKTADTLEVARVSIWMFNKERNCIKCIDLFERLVNQHSEGQELLLKDYPNYFRALDKDGIVDVNDAINDPRTSEFATYYLNPRGITSMLDAPIHLEGKLGGVVCNEQVGEKRAWTIEEQSFASSIADIIAITIETFERKKAKQEMEISLALTKATIESTADGILVVDNDGKFTGMNQQFVKMWQIPESIIEKRDDGLALTLALDQVKHPETFMAKVKELYSDKNKESFDILEFKDGRIIERYSKPQIWQDKIIGRVWSFRDITQRRQSEEQVLKLNAELENRVKQRTREVNMLNKSLKKNIRELEITNEELESFSYTVSHDLRAPLRSINGFISVLEAKYGSQIDPEAKKLLEVIAGNAKKMGQLIDDLLTFSRLGKKEMEKSNIDMNEMINSLLKEIDITEWNSKTKVIVNNLLPIVGDRSLLGQVFFNLISNAVKYSRTKDEPIIMIESYADESQKENVYTVKDNGVGFNMEYYNKLFKVFQRLHTANEFEGVGIGLAIVHRIVARHGGRVWAEGKENEGATFYVSLPTGSDLQTEVPAVY